MSKFKYTFEQLVDLAQVKNLLESHHQLSGMTYAILDLTENVLIAVGWQDICVRFHRVNPVSRARCCESDAFIKRHLRDFDGTLLEYPCKNGLIDVAMPIIVDGQHLATFFTGQFFYQDARPDPAFFIQQAEDLDFNREAYLAALQQVPAFTREQVRDQMLFLGNLVKGLSQYGLDNLKLKREIENRRRAEALLYKREQEFRIMIENAADLVTRYDGNCRRIYVNPAFEKLMGQPAHLLLGKTPYEVPMGGQAGLGLKAHQAINRAFNEGIPTEVELFWNDDGGLEHCYKLRFVPEFNQKGTVTSVLSTGRDIGTLNAYQRQLHDLAYYDRLTGLPNRALFLDHLQHAVADRSLSKQKMVGLMLLDLDRFKTVNDSFGHSAGDNLLRQVGQRLKQKVRDCDMVARLGGDEFAIILPHIRHGEALGIIASEVLTAFNEPFDLQGRLVQMTASIGIASCPEDSRDAFELLQMADTAMYHARSKGRNHLLFCSKELSASAKVRLTLEGALHNALKQHEFELYYQPKVELQSGKLIGAEALLRWHHPELGIVSPDQFIPIAEDSGMIIELGEWVLRSACRTIARWNRTGDAPLKVAVNFSPRQFDKKNLVETVAAILEQTGCQPEWLELEVTESLLLEERDDVLNMLKRLTRMGCTIAIDDFGTGYSALGYLTKFPINTLKIDRSFVSNVTTTRESAVLVKAIVFMAHALGLDLVAEGVETNDQAAFLDDIECRYAQGYLFGKPVPQEQFEEMIKSGVAKGRNNYGPVMDQWINYPWPC